MRVAPLSNGWIATARRHLWTTCHRTGRPGSVSLAWASDPVMRIVAGRLKGRRLTAPPGDAVRPTSDSLRETLFNVLADRVDGARVLDAFAGTGALGLEALSRGAAHATFIERDRRVIRVLRENVARCGAEDACTIIGADFTTVDET